VLSVIFKNHDFYILVLLDNTFNFNVTKIPSKSLCAKIITRAEQMHNAITENRLCLFYE